MDPPDRDDPYPHTRICPDCGAAIPHGMRYPTWCECGWNVKPYTPEAPDYTSSYSLALISIAMGTERRDMVTATAAAIAAIPERERERLRRAEELEESSLSSTHPPTAFRLGAIRAGQSFSATLMLELSIEEEEAIVREIARLYASLTAVAVERYKRRLYR